MNWAPTTSGDFSQADGDHIDLRLIDATALAVGNQVFNFIGNNVPYTGAAGELRFNFGSLEGDSRC